VISDDVETQKHGIVLMFSISEEGRERLGGEYHDDFMKTMKNPPYRVAVCHQFLPDGHKYQLFRVIWFLVMIPKDQRVRTKFHRDLSLLETQYDLLTYGIPVHQIPRTHTGNIKVKNHLQWISTRIAIDMAREISPDVSSLDCRIIDHPGRHDVLFSRGGNSGYPGNVEFQQEAGERLVEFMSSSKESRKRICNEIVACIVARNGRFLQLQKGCWWEVLPPDKVHDKITAFMYDHNRRLGLKEPEQQTKSSTSVFLPANKRQKVGDDGSLSCGCNFF
jgi:hypothetical protein